MLGKTLIPVRRGPALRQEIGVDNVRQASPCLSTAEFMNATNPIALVTVIRTFLIFGN